MLKLFINVKFRNDTDWVFGAVEIVLLSKFKIDIQIWLKTIFLCKFCARNYYEQIIEHFEEKFELRQH